MMKKEKLILILFVLLSTDLIAQNEIRLGAKAGINLAGFHKGKSANTDNVLFNIEGTINGH